MANKQHYSSVIHVLHLRNNLIINVQEKNRKNKVNE